MVLTEENVTYQQLLNATVKGLEESGAYSAELSGEQATGLMRSVVEDAARAKLPGFVSANVDELSVAIGEKDLTVTAAITAGVGPVRRTIRGKAVLEGDVNDQGLKASEVTADPPSLHIPGPVYGTVKKVAGIVAGKDVHVPQDIDIQGPLKNALGGNTNDLAAKALNAQLEKRGVVATGVQMAITPERRLRVSLRGRRTGPAQ